MRTDILDVINNAFEKHPQQGDRIFADGVETAGAEVYGYIYLILDIDTKTVVYVGQSTNPRYRTSLQESQMKLPCKKLFMLVVDSYCEYWRVVGYINILDLEGAYIGFFYAFNSANNLFSILNKTYSNDYDVGRFVIDSGSTLNSRCTEYVQQFLCMYVYRKARDSRVSVLKRIRKIGGPATFILARYNDIFPFKEEFAEEFKRRLHEIELERQEIEEERGKIRRLDEHLIVEEYHIKEEMNHRIREICIRFEEAQLHIEEEFLLEEERHLIRKRNDVLDLFLFDKSPFLKKERIRFNERCRLIQMCHLPESEYHRRIKEENLRFEEFCNRISKVQSEKRLIANHFSQEMSRIKKECANQIESIWDGYYTKHRAYRDQENRLTQEEDSIFLSMIEISIHYGKGFSLPCYPCVIKS